MILEALCEYAKKNKYTVLYAPQNEDMIIISTGERQLIIYYNDDLIEFTMRLPADMLSICARHTTMVRISTIDPSNPKIDLVKELTRTFAIVKEYAI